ncbi:MAG: DUF1616 domain-containing protein [Haloarculaceae archaeon]
MSKQSANENWAEQHLPATVSKYFPSNIDIPGDIYAVTGYLVVANLLLLYVLPTTAVVPRSLVGFPLLFFIPGYVLIAVLFPARETAVRLDGSRATSSHSRQRDRRGLAWRERLALSFGSSVALLPLVGLVISLVGLDYDGTTIVTATSFVCALGLVPAVVYRSREPPTTRFYVPVDDWIATVKNGIFRQDRRSAVVNVAIAVLVVTTVVGVGYAMVVPNNAESFTSVSLLTTNDQGELVAADYPEAINESGAELTLELESAEESTTDYTVVAELQRVDTSGASVTVTERATVTRMETQLAPGESWTRQHTVEPELSGEDLRLIYYVYEGDTPSEPSTESADEYVAVWVDVPQDSE